jgi:hypothetical protein
MFNGKYYKQVSHAKKLAMLAHMKVEDPEKYKEHMDKKRVIW